MEGTLQVANVAEGWPRGEFELLIIVLNVSLYYINEIILLDHKLEITTSLRINFFLIKNSCILKNVQNIACI